MYTDARDLLRQLLYVTLRRGENSVEWIAVGSRLIPSGPAEDHDMASDLEPPCCPGPDAASLIHNERLPRWTLARVSAQFSWAWKRTAPTKYRRSSARTMSPLAGPRVRLLARRAPLSPCVTIFVGRRHGIRRSWNGYTIPRVVNPLAKPMLLPGAAYRNRTDDLRITSASL
jgi:hypothetical protein